MREQKEIRKYKHVDEGKTGSSDDIFIVRFYVGISLFWEVTYSDLKE